MNLNVDPHKLFGTDLSAVFGPIANRIHISKLTNQEIKARIEKLPKYVSTDHLGDFPTLFEIANTILLKMKQSKALEGVDLDWCSTLKTTGLVRPDEMYKPVAQCAKNNKAQRGIQLRHLVGDILFKFNPKWVQTGLARFSEKTGHYYLNDAQHRYIGCIILGVREIPLEYEVSEFKSVDVQQYSCVNLGSLVASEFDKYRTMVETVRIAESEGNEITDPDFLAAWNIYKILEAYGCRMIEKGGEPAKALECTGAGNLIKHYKDYGEEIFTRAIDINVSVFTKAPLATPNVWGLCEFIKRQKDADVLDGNDMFVDMYIAESLSHHYPDGKRNGFYLEVHRALDKSEAADYSIPYEDIVAAGIEKVARIVHPDVAWAPVMFNSVNISENYLEEMYVAEVSH
jgi:hypothetical protein